jgi:hypothetical protein
MVACINAIVGGVTVAIAVGWLLGASLAVAAVAGAVATLACVTVFFVHQIRRFQQAAAVIPELFAGPSPGMPGWAGR